MFADTKEQTPATLDIRTSKAASQDDTKQFGPAEYELEDGSRSCMEDSCSQIWTRTINARQKALKDLVDVSKVKQAHPYSSMHFDT